MCKIGDILLIFNAKNNKYSVGPHPFIVLDDNAGTVKGIYSYDFVGLLVSSADTEEKKERLKKFEGNFPLVTDDKIMNSNFRSENRDGYVKADQFFYFDKNKISYVHIGKVVQDAFDIIVEFIGELASKGVKFEQIVDKAEKN